MVKGDWIKKGAVVIGKFINNLIPQNFLSHNIILDCGINSIIGKF